MPGKRNAHVLLKGSLPGLNVIPNPRSEPCSDVGQVNEVRVLDEIAWGFLCPRQNFSLEVPFKNI